MDVLPDACPRFPAPEIAARLLTLPGASGVASDTSREGLVFGTPSGDRPISRPAYRRREVPNHRRFEPGHRGKAGRRLRVRICGEFAKIKARRPCHLFPMRCYRGCSDMLGNVRIDSDPIASNRRQKCSDMLGNVRIDSDERIKQQGLIRTFRKGAIGGGRPECREADRCAPSYRRTRS